MKIQTSEFVRSSVDAEGLIGDGEPQVAFAGRSNVGKSSLLNKLLGVRLARTSSTPGRTQTINYFRVNRRYWFVDLPGYGFARAARTERQRWAALVASYLARDAEHRLVVQLVDAKVGATDLDVAAAEYLESLGARRIAVATKIDRLKRGARAAALARIGTTLQLGPEATVIAVSAVTGEGVRELWKFIADFLAGQVPAEP
ncbi:MAG: YihA family ribosome biogenesis GTP-binding protein [Acidobacteria bacterium]|nr:YihA family ribosome biogenesis GTP-binding protein [Acidobacteriota bacterium]